MLGDVLAKNNWLRKLDLESNQLGAGAQKLFESLKINPKSRLIELNLAYNQIEENIAQFLKNFIEANLALAFIDFKGNKIKDNGANKILKALKKNVNLIIFNVANNSIKTEKTVTSINEKLGANKKLCSELHNAAKNGSLANFEYYHKLKLSLLSRFGEEDNTPLHCAALAGHENIIQYYIDNHVSPLVYNSKGQTPLDLTKKEDCKKLLIANMPKTQTVVVEEEAQPDHQVDDGQIDLLKQQIERQRKLIRAQRHFQAKNWQSALALYDELLLKDSTLLDALLGKAQVYKEQALASQQDEDSKELEIAKREYEKVIEEAKRKPEKDEEIILIATEALQQIEKEINDREKLKEVQIAPVEIISEPAEEPIPVIISDDPTLILQLTRLEESLLEQKLQTIFEREQKLINKHNQFLVKQNMIEEKEQEIKRQQTLLKEKAFALDKREEELKQKENESDELSQQEFFAQIEKERQQLSEKEKLLQAQSDKIASEKKELDKKYEELETEKKSFDELRIEVETKLEKKQREITQQHQQQLTEVQQEREQSIKLKETHEKKINAELEQWQREKKQLQSEKKQLQLKQRTLEKQQQSTHLSEKEIASQQAVIQQQLDQITAQEKKLNQQKVILEQEKQQIAKKIENLTRREQALHDATEQNKQLRDHKNNIKKLLNSAKVEQQRAESLRRQALAAEQSAKAKKAEAKTAEELLKLQLRFNPVDPLLRAIKTNNDEAVQVCLQLGMDPNVFLEENGTTTLHLAANHASLKIIEILIQAGALANVKNKVGQTPATYFTTLKRCKKNQDILLALQTAEQQANIPKGIKLFAEIADSINVAAETTGAIDEQFLMLVEKSNQIRKLYTRLVNLADLLPAEKEPMDLLYKTYGMDCFNRIISQSSSNRIELEKLRQEIHKIHSESALRIEAKHNLEKQINVLSKKIQVLLYYSFEGQQLDIEAKVRNHYRNLYNNIQGLQSMQITENVNQAWRQFQVVFSHSFDKKFLKDCAFSEEHISELLKSKHNDVFIETQLELLTAQLQQCQNKLQSKIKISNFYEVMYHIMKTELDLSVSLNQAQIENARKYYFKKIQPKLKTSSLQKKRRKVHSYEFAHKIDREEAKLILEQTGVKIAFEKDENIVSFTLGQGAFGKIRLAYDTKNSRYVIVKKIKGLAAIGESLQERLLHEELTDCENILPLYDSYITEDSKRAPVIYQFSPIAGFGDGDKLKKQLKSLRSYPDKAKIISLIRHVAKGILNGILQMHKRNKCHFDFKPANFLITMTGDVFVSDFGCARKFNAEENFWIGDTADKGLNPSKDELAERQKKWPLGDTKYYPPERWGLFRYMAPFAMQGPAKEIQYGCDATKIDAWAAGLILLELNYVEFPFEAIDQFNYCDSEYMRNQLDNFFVEKKSIDPEMTSIIKGLLEIDPVKRSSVEQALNSPILTQTHFSSSQELTQTIQWVKQYTPQSVVPLDYVQSQLLHKPESTAINTDQLLPSDHNNPSI